MLHIVTYTTETETRYHVIETDDQPDYHTWDDVNVLTTFTTRRAAEQFVKTAVSRSQQVAKVLTSAGQVNVSRTPDGRFYAEHADGTYGSSRNFASPAAAIREYAHANSWRVFPGTFSRVVS